MSSLLHGPAFAAEETPAALAWAHPVIQEWFVGRFGTPTEPQIEGWPSILSRTPTLISAPTGSGKTLAAFLICIDSLFRKACEGRLADRTEVIYVSPLKALSNDVQKNLDGPLAEIERLGLERGILSGRIRTGVRTGDTLPRERQAMLKHPPHILVTTPESLYILLTAEKSRNNLRNVHTVIVDEIHAIADDKRGSHLALTLERLDALVTGENNLSPGGMLTAMSEPPLRIGLSATQNPIELVADFFAGAGSLAPTGQIRPRPNIIQIAGTRKLDVAVEIPRCDELGSVCSIAMWESVFDRIAELAQQHRSTLVFVNTRKMTERLAFALGERLGVENVAAHHGSLSRHLRLEAEQKLKAGQIRVLVATASLELGIDIGSVELVCQINSSRAFAVAVQRIGRSGHWRGATPKGRLFATTRDDLVECAALVAGLRTGKLDRIEIPDEPLDVLMQQIIAACAAEHWEEDRLFALLTRAWPYRNLRREVFDELLALLTTGIAPERGRYGAYLMRDGVNGHVHARRGARTAAVSNGGAIPDSFLYNVVLQPEGITIATLDEHFAIDSSPGDVVQLGNASWRIQRIETGRVIVEDAQGAPPTVPFWFGEAPARTIELSQEVARLRCRIADATPDVLPGYVHSADPAVAACASSLFDDCGLDEPAALALINYVAAGRAVLGCVPSTDTLVAERFFDEGGGMQLILHAPFGARINRAWGLALRKRFCRGFNFELQAAATDNGLNISLAEQHSFPLSDVFQFLTTQTVTELLEQASLASPIFKTRWRWAAGRSLQLLRFQKGKRVPPQIQRTRSDDLLASVFPQAAACFENIEGDIQIPDHALVREVMKDVLGEAMDLVGLTDILARIADGRMRCVAVDTTTPSPFSHELLNGAKYTFLDDAPLEERRARAISMRRSVPDSVLGEAGRLDPAAIHSVREQAWPDLRDEHELHDALCAMVIFPADILAAQPAAHHWPEFFSRLAQHNRAHAIEKDGRTFWHAAERAEMVHDIFDRGNPDAIVKTVQGWLPVLGPVTASALSKLLALDAAKIAQALVLIESSGAILRGVFEGATSVAPLPLEDVEFCERHLLQRIHRRTLNALRREIQPVTAAQFMEWLAEWQHTTPRTQLSGESGVLEAVRLLAGFEAPAISWERELLPQRVANYDPRWLDQLCLAGVIGWGRFSPHPALTAERASAGAPRAIVPSSMAPITLFLRDECEWMRASKTQQTDAAISLSPSAQSVLHALCERGACFVADIVRITSLAKADVERALWELAAAGFATADGFDSLRLLIDPRRRSNGTPARNFGTVPKQIRAAGRWCLLRPEMSAAAALGSPSLSAGEYDAALHSAAVMLLTRYGVLFREILARESNVPRWRDLLPLLRRMESRGEVRGGRFVAGMSGEQYALPHAVESLRAARTRNAGNPQTFSVAAADPLNLAGVVVPNAIEAGTLVTSMPGRKVWFRGGVHIADANSPANSDLAAIPDLAATTPAQGELLA
jgi:ATP-dependent Lhr-like helicase